MSIRSACLLIGVAAVVAGCRHVVKDPELLGQLNSPDWTITSEPKDAPPDTATEKTQTPKAATSP